LPTRRARPPVNAKLMFTPVMNQQDFAIGLVKLAR
jgi:hypothetical protein